jgi:hypothetical protein
VGYRQAAIYRSATWQLYGVDIPYAVGRMRSIGGCGVGWTKAECDDRRLALEPFWKEALKAAKDHRTWISNNKADTCYADAYEADREIGQRWIDMLDGLRTAPWLSPDTGAGIAQQAEWSEALDETSEFLDNFSSYFDNCRW